MKKKFNSLVACKPYFSFKVLNLPTQTNACDNGDICIRKTIQAKLWFTYFNGNNKIPT